MQSNIFSNAVISTDRLMACLRHDRSVTIKPGSTEPKHPKLSAILKYEHGSHVKNNTVPHESCVQMVHVC